MKKQFSSYLKKINIIANVFILMHTTIGNVSGQTINPPPPRTLPQMHVPMRDGQLRKDNFGKIGLSPNSKYRTLSNNLSSIGINIPETKSIFYSLKSFRDLIDSVSLSHKKSLRIFIAAYDKTCDPFNYVPDDFDKHLTLIFAPESEAHDIGPYFIIKHDGAVTSINATIKEAWVGYYEQNKLLALSPTIYPQDPDNACCGTFSDTRSMIYEMKDIKEFFTDEINHQINDNHVAVNGIRVDFASYGISGNGHGYRYRFIVQFELTKTNAITGGSEVFYIDNIPGDPRLNKSNTGSHNILVTADNGQLCPPASGCPNP